MVDEEILKLRKELNDSIMNEEGYDIIYRLSVELDEAIAKYYNTKLKEKVKIKM